MHLQLDEYKNQKGSDLPQKYNKNCKEFMINK